jgi:hypothetical protein
LKRGENALIANTILIKQWGIRGKDFEENENLSRKAVCLYIKLSYVYFLQTPNYICVAEFSSPPVCVVYALFARVESQRS